METSIIIRVKNEKQNLDKLFGILKSQTYQDFEIVIVDNNSTDGSEKVPYKYFPKERIKVINIKNFTFPKACNMGADKASGHFLVYLSAHSYPISNTWLEDGLSNFKNKIVAGVFAYPISGSDSTIWEKIFYGIPNKIRKKKGGQIGNTNSIIRKDLWEKHHFDEKLENSEDYEWSKYWSSKKLLIINDPRFAVFHTHRLNLVGMIRQEYFWKKGNISTFKKFNSRNY